MSPACTFNGPLNLSVAQRPPGISCPTNGILSRVLDCLGAFRADTKFDWAVQAIRKQRADVRPLISAQLPISQSKTAFDLVLDRSRSTPTQPMPG